MANNKRINKAYVRYDGSGRVIPGSLVLNRFKPKVGNWSEIPAYECCNSVPPDVLTRTLCAQITYPNGAIESILFVFSETIDGRDVYTRIFNSSEIDYYGHVCRYDSELETYVIYYVYGYSEGTFEELYFTGENQFPNSPLDVTGWVPNTPYVDPEAILNIFECAEPEFARFDVTADWSLTTPAVVDETSFRTFLESGSDGDDNLNRFINLRIRNFSLSGGRLQCDLKAYTEHISLANINVTQFNSVGGYTNIFSSIYLNSNQIVTFDPNLPLPASLLGLNLPDNQIVTFNPSLPLPNLLQRLSLSENQIVTFNPTTALPSSLIELHLNGNQIVTFNPSIALPNSLKQLILDYNQMTTAGYTSSEPWANAMTVIPSRGYIYFTGNIDSVSGTNLETILIAKGWNMIE